MHPLIGTGTALAPTVPIVMPRTTWTADAPSARLTTATSISEIIRSTRLRWSTRPRLISSNAITSSPDTAGSSYHGVRVAGQRDLQ
jgi:hypothetical protein